MFYGSLEGEGEPADAVGVAPGVTLFPVAGVRREDPADRKLDGLALDRAADSLAKARDRFRLHEVAVLTARETGVPLVVLAGAAADASEDWEWHDLAAHRPAVAAALSHHATQLTVVGAEVVHVGGQREPIRTSARKGTRPGSSKTWRVARRAPPRTAAENPRVDSSMLQPPDFGANTSVSSSERSRGANHWPRTAK